MYASKGTCWNNLTTNSNIHLITKREVGLQSKKPQGPNLKHEEKIQDHD
jgi:hypothetical protein